MSSGGGAGRNLYRKMKDNRRKIGLPAKIWASLRRAALKSIAMYVGKRRVLVGWVRKVVWASLDLRRRVVRAAARGRKDRQALAAYDPMSYSQNFDDGRWREEEEEYYSSRSFAQRFGHSGRFAP